MKIVIDIDIPHIFGVFEPFFKEVIYEKGVDINPFIVANADALIVRTRTICNQHLLRNSKVKAIATATIGTDHIDIDYCKSKGIAVYSAPGCNAGGVLQWFLSALFELVTNKKDLSDILLGVVGVGNIGSLIVDAAQNLGITVLQCDPPRERAEGKKQFTTFNTIAKECDVITFHVPLAYSGMDATYKMADENFYRNLKPNSCIINTSRGEVIDEKIMINYIHNKRLKVALDVWENEPHISKIVLNQTKIGTPHIAGYSLEGKINATVIVVNSIAKHFGIGIKSWYPEQGLFKEKNYIDIDNFIEGELIKYKDFFNFIYPIYNDDQKLKENPSLFEQIRNNYTYRRENCSYTIVTKKRRKEIEMLEKLGFNQ